MKKGQLKSDYIALEKIIKESSELEVEINRIKPTIPTCNRLLHYINYNKDIDVTKKNNCGDIIINYVNANKLLKDRGFYHIALQHMVNILNIDKQEELIDEMIKHNIKIKVSTYVPVIKTAFILYESTNNFKYFMKAFSIIEQNIGNHTFVIPDELFIMMFHYINIAKQRYDNWTQCKLCLIKTLHLLSQHTNTINIDIYDSIITLFSNINIIKSSQFEIDSEEVKALSHRQIPLEHYEILYQNWYDKHNKTVKPLINNIRKICNFHTKRLLDSKKPTILIDGANVGYYINRKRDTSKNSFYKQIDSAVNYFKDNGWNVVIFLYYTHIDNPPTEEGERYVKSWRNPHENVIRYDVKGCNDDIIWMAAGFYYNMICERHDVYILSNDMMRNHHDDLSDSFENEFIESKFFQWRDKHQITYNINYSHTGAFPKFTPNIIPYSHFTQINTIRKDIYDIYFPVTTDKIGKRNERLQKADSSFDKFNKDSKKAKWYYYQIDISE